MEKTELFRSRSDSSAAVLKGDLCARSLLASTVGINTCKKVKETVGQREEVGCWCSHNRGSANTMQSSGDGMHFRAGSRGPGWVPWHYSVFGYSLTPARRGKLEQNSSSQPKAIPREAWQWRVVCKQQPSCPLEAMRNHRGCGNVSYNVTGEYG